MRGRRILLPAFSYLAALLLAASCGGTPDVSDAGDSGGDKGIDDCVVDNSQRRTTSPDWELTPGGEARSGHICPKSDIDYYWFSVAQPRTIVEVTLKNNIMMSAVDLCYDVFFEGQDTKVGGKCDYDGLDGVTEVIGTHYLASAGNYFLEVRDASQDDEDPRNAYMLSIETVIDPDTYEPNNTPAEAKTVGMDKGYISYLGDQDWYKIDASVGQILIVDLTTTGAAEVDLRYTLYMPDGSTPVNAGEDFNGMDGATAMHDVLPLNQTGTYYLQVVDTDDDDSDLTVGYSLTLTVRNNDDVRDQTAPFNNTWETATPVNSGQTISNAYLATRGDEDWYKIESPGTTDTSPALLEIDVRFPPGSPVDPGVDLIVADPRTDCNPGDECDILETWSCGGCEHIIECINAQCPSHECHTGVGKCRGAGMCLPRVSGNGCGIRSLTMHGAEWSETGSAQHLHTVAPMFGDTYYILVRDYPTPDQDVDYQNAYSFTATVINEPDPYEPNGMYLPYLTGTQEDETRDWNRNMAKTVSCSIDAAGLTCGPIQGWLSYRGDQDWYKLQVSGQSYTVPAEPEPVPEADSTVIDWDIQFEWSFGTSENMQIGFAIPFGQEMGDVFNPGSGTWGTGSGECSYFCGESQLPATAYLWVYTPGFKNYDYSSGYSITVKGYRGCPLNCSFCQPDSTYYPCPTPDNPDPW